MPVLAETQNAHIRYSFRIVQNIRNHFIGILNSNIIKALLLTFISFDHQHTHIWINSKN